MRVNVLGTRKGVVAMSSAAFEAEIAAAEHRGALAERVKCEAKRMPTYDEFCNGFKGAMLGEFWEEEETECPDCEGCGLGDPCPHAQGESRCKTCNGAGDLTHKVYISWDNIKAIYKRACDISKVKPK